jgi:CxxC motif-containing protein (DUF1111 family)
MKHYITSSALLLAGALLTLGCTDDDNNSDNSSSITPEESDGAYVGKAVDGFTAEEWYPGGELGTTTNIASNCYEDNTPAVEAQGFNALFQQGDRMASNPYTISTKPYNGWGPVASRQSCSDCHSGGYSHGHSRTDFLPKKGNGYIVSVYTPDAPGSNDGPLVEQLTTFTMTMAMEPFKPQLDPTQVKIEWHDVTEMKSGLKMQFPDNGETFELRYPTATVPVTAFNADPRPAEGSYDVRLIVSCNFQGLGLIDAVSNEALEAQYKSEDSYGAELNPEFWDASAKKLKDDAYAEDAFGNKFVKRFNYDLLEGCLQNDVALWDELNVLRSDIKHICTTKAWTKAMSEDTTIINQILAEGANPQSPLHPYYYDGTFEGIKAALTYLLSPEDDINLYDNKYYNFTPEMTDDQYHAFMTWHRGIAVPRARDLNNKDVKRGKELFYEIGCTNCHKPSWTTGADNYGRSKILEGKNLPQYANQKIYPYSDLLQHKLCMEQDIHGSWCRTTPLWGRGLSSVVCGKEDRLHDARARNEVEAIMWHAYSKDSQAYDTALKFYNLPKADRDAVVKFIRSI